MSKGISSDRAIFTRVSTLGFDTPLSILPRNLKSIPALCASSFCVSFKVTLSSLIFFPIFL